MSPLGITAFAAVSQKVADAGQGTIFIKFPYGDDGKDSVLIILGYVYYEYYYSGSCELK